MVVGEPQRQTSSQLGPIEKGPQKFKTSFQMRDATDSKFGIDLALKILRSAKLEWAVVCGRSKSSFGPVPELHCVTIGRIEQPKLTTSVNHPFL